MGRKHNWKHLEVMYVDLTNEELSFFYLLNHYSAPAIEQQRLHNEAMRRGLDEKTMKILVREREFKSNNYGCARCNTVKPYEKDSCVICGYKKRGEREPGKYLAALELIGPILEAVAGIFSV